MPKLILEIDNGEQFEVQLAAVKAVETKPAAKKPAAKKPAAKKIVSPRDKCEALLGKLDRKAKKAMLEEYDAKNIADVEEEDLDDLLLDLEEEVDVDEDEEDSTDSEITVEAVKTACQAYSKKNSKEEMDEIFSDYDIKSVRSLGKLSPNDLEDLYAEVTDD